MYAVCELCNEEVKLHKYALLKREGDIFKASRNIKCFKCNVESNVIINVEARQNELREIRLKHEKEEKKRQKELTEKRLKLEREEQDRLEKIRVEQLKPHIEFKNETLILYFDLKDNKDIRMIFSNFIRTLRIKFGFIDNILQFQRILRSEVPVGYLLLNRDEDEEIPFNYVNPAIKKEYSDKFLRLANLMKRKYGIVSDEKSIYLSWMLFQDEIIRIESISFKNEFGFNYVATGKNLDTYLKAFVNDPMIDTGSRHMIFSFTLFLINEGLLDSSDIFSNIRFVEKRLQALLADKINDDFEKQLMGIEKKPLERWDISDIDLMNGHEFEYFVSHLLVKWVFQQQ
ncbi:hypothetical protein [Paenibacillus harenae]|uniref:Uncharacterized protein n=1 Tax=Paenibacillus harenae TaxID=306543 RepID=A0ABT9UAY4_PAEHA|nr:hypothetical protein [Paenibacillus harenae]MDQ0116791.1 hypothetical protein [Paenibacillus harenae]